MGMQGIRVGMRGIRMGMLGNHGGNAGNHGRNAGHQGGNAGNQGGNSTFFEQHLWRAATGYLLHHKKQEKQRYIDWSICFIVDAFRLLLSALSNHFITCKKFLLQAYFLQISFKLTWTNSNWQYLKNCNEAKKQWLLYYGKETLL